MYLMEVILGLLLFQIAEIHWSQPNQMGVNYKNTTVLQNHRSSWPLNRFIEVLETLSIHSSSVSLFFSGHLLYSSVCFTDWFLLYL
jgi:hypothetical protein